MKKGIKYFFLTVITSIFLSFPSFADSFTNAIQDLAVWTACVGQYSATQAGGGWYEDPYDYYTPNLIAGRLATESGTMTRTQTFYGVCFDYAQYAYEYVWNNKNYFNSQGMYESQVWIAGVYDNPKQITLQYPGTKSNYTTIQNGVYVKVPDKGGARSVSTHDSATNHAWIWIERNDGIWFWVDPTWTDNLGYVVYGYVSNGKEIQCKPDNGYCINYPSSLNNLPSPPSMGQKQQPSSTANSNNPEETIENAASALVNLVVSLVSLPKTLSSGYICNVGVQIPLQSKAVGFNFSLGEPYEPHTSFIWHFQMDYYLLKYQWSQEKDKVAVIFDLNLGVQFGPVIGFYGGAGIGYGCKSYFPWPWMGDLSFAYRWDAGIRIAVEPIKACFKVEVSWTNKTGYSIGLYNGGIVF